MNYSIIIYILGFVLKVEGIFMLLPSMIAVLYHEKSGFAYVGATYQSYNFHMMIPGKNAKFRKSTQRIYGDGIITQKSCLREKAAI